MQGIGEFIALRDGESEKISMTHNTLRQWWISLNGLAVWSFFQGVILAQPLSMQSGILDNPSLQAQQPNPTAAVSTLIFRAFASDAPLSEIQIPLKQAIAALPTETTVLGGDGLGPVMLQSKIGGNQHLESYVWSVDPASRLYFSRSGYKSFVARYQYAEARQSPQYILHVACHTTDLTPQNSNQSEKATCRLFGNGPLLKGEFQSTGQLSLGAAPSATTDPPASTSAQAASYRRGYELGQLDAQQKLERSYARHRTEFNASSEAEFQRGYENAYSNFTNQGSPLASRATVTYQGRGSVVLYPITSQAAEERYTLTQIALNEGEGDTRLSLMAESPSRTVVFRGQVESTEGGKILNLTTVDGLPAQGKLFLSHKGLLRTVSPILLRADDQEISVYFRPNS
jgi:hypothetical protein